MDGKQLSQTVRQKAQEFKRVSEGIDEDTASRAPEGRWSPKQIVSHLCGPEGTGLTTILRAFLDQDTPELNLEPGNPFFSAKRSGMTFAALLKEFDKHYEGVADFVSGLSDQQLSRKARVPALKDSPLGEYPTLGAFVQGIVEYHIGFHVDHMREILQALGAKPKP